MFNLSYVQMNSTYRTSDALCAPACCAAHQNMLSLCADTAMLVVSFLHVIMAIICGLVRIITPSGAKP